MSTTSTRTTDIGPVAGPEDSRKDESRPWRAAYSMAASSKRAAVSPMALTRAVQSALALATSAAQAACRLATRPRCKVSPLPFQDGCGVCVNRCCGISGASPRKWRPMASRHARVVMRLSERRSAGSISRRRPCASSCSRAARDGASCSRAARDGASCSRAARDGAGGGGGIVRSAEAPKKLAIGTVPTSPSQPT
jgi:hypothetical protein